MNTKQIIHKVNSEAWKNAGMFMVKRDYEVWAYISVILFLATLMFLWVYQANYYDGIMLDHCIAFDSCVVIQ